MHPRYFELTNAPACELLWVTVHSICFCLCATRSAAAFCIVTACGNVAVCAVCSVEVQYNAVDQASPAASVSEVVPEWGKRLLDEAAVPLPPRGPPVQRCWHDVCSKTQ